MDEGQSKGWIFSMDLSDFNSLEVKLSSVFWSKKRRDNANPKILVPLFSCRTLSFAE
jgi:hypothetical protein